MKKDQFSYLNGRALSHASLQKFRNQTLQSKGEKEIFSSKPIIKYYVNSNQNKNSVAIKTEQRRLEMSKNEQELKKKIKVLEYQLKNKLTQNSMMVKFFRAKNSSELPHIDIYLQFRKVQQQLEQKDELIQSLSKKLEQIQLEKQQQQVRHTEQVQNFIQNVQKHKEVKNKQIIEQKKKREQKEKQIMEQKKKTEEKDELLRQIRKKYEQSRQRIIDLENQLDQVVRDKVEIQKVYKQKLENAKQDQEVKIDEKRREKIDLQRKIKELYEKIKEQEQKIKMTHQKYTERQLQKLKNMKGLENEVNTLKKQIGQKVSQIQSLTQQRTKYHQNVKRTEELLTQKSIKIQELTMKLVKNTEVTNNSKQQSNEMKSQLKELELKKEKAFHEIKTLEQKLGETNGKNKSMQFQIEQKQVLIEKMKSCMQEKQRYIKEKQKYIEQMECKMYNNERKIANYVEKIKEMENGVINAKQLHAKQPMSKLEIQNYKSIGRLLELIHQVKALSSQNQQQNDHRNRNSGNRSRKSQLQTITECIDELNKQFDLFNKAYSLSREQNKDHKQFEQEIISNLKDLFHAYNSYIHDQQLKGATRQYLQCLDSRDKNNNKKQRNSYLQVIMQRLITMIAIQSYTSENGLKRNSESRTRLSNKRDIADSLQNTYQKLQQNQYKQHIKPYVQDRGYRKRGLQPQLQRYSRNSQNKRRSSYNKLTTQPNQQVYNIRKLDYGNKENIFQRINRGGGGGGGGDRDDGQAKKYNYFSVEEKDRQCEKFKFYEPSAPKDVSILKKLKNYVKQPEVKERKLSAKDTELIEKKYFS